jgi:hypothetical protein
MGAISGIAFAASSWGRRRSRCGERSPGTGRAPPRRGFRLTAEATLDAERSVRSRLQR